MTIKTFLDVEVLFTNGAVLKRTLADGDAFGKLDDASGFMIRMLHPSSGAKEEITIYRAEINYLSRVERQVSMIGEPIAPPTPSVKPRKGRK